MVSFIQAPPNDYPANLCEMLLRNVAQLQVTNQILERAIRDLRPACKTSAELLDTLDRILEISGQGQIALRKAITESGAVLPTMSESTAHPLVSWIWATIPHRVMTEVTAADVVSNLRLLVQHLELQTTLAAEETALVGQVGLGHALLEWSAEWQVLGEEMRSVNVRFRAHAYIADVPNIMPPLAAAIV